MRRLSLRLVATLLAAVFATLLAGLIWLGGSSSGLQTVLQLAAAASGGRLQVAEVDGRLLGPLHIGQLRWASPDLQLDAEALHLDWSPAALLRGRLQIAALTAERLQIVSPPSSAATPPPTELLLPLAIDIERIAIATLAYGNVFSLEHLSGRLDSDGRRHRLRDLRAESSGFALNGEALLDGAAPLPLTAGGEISSRLAERPLAFALQANGPLERIALQLVGRQGLAGSAAVVLTPFAPAAFASAQLAVNDLDPADWLAGAPRAKLKLSADLAPQGDGVAGRFTVDNAQAGPFDRQRLPLASLRGRLDWQGASCRLSEITADLAGAGLLAGHGRWQDGSLELDLQAAKLDAARLVSTLRSTRLAGPVNARLATNRQELELDLHDARFALRAQFSHAGTQLGVDRFELSSGPARLALSGTLALDERMDFSASGEISRFDPSLFARLPAARINASFTTQGRLQPQPVIDGSFQLSDSQVAAQALHGQGRLRLDWPRSAQADIELSAGANSLRAQGAFGRPGEQLSVVISAPELAPFGLQGGFDARLELGGSPAQPELQAALQAGRLGLPGVGQVSELTLQGKAGTTPASPLHVELSIGRVDSDARPALAKQLRLQLDGSQQAHRLHASGDLAADSRFSLEAAGGLQHERDGRRWQGRVHEARLSGAAPARNFHLAAPAELKLGASDWSFGPAQLAGDPLDWRATVQAGADRRALQASLSAHGARVGRIDGSLTAGMRGAWSLDRSAPWHGSLASDIADLGWLGELVGDGWQSAGHLSGQLRLAGSPARPLASGSFRGEQLALRQVQQGLHLANGDLAIDLDDQLLRLRQLSFDSQLQAPPRALRLGSRDDLAALTRQPGRLELSGEMHLDRQGGERAFIDVRLDRVGAFQLPEQWLLLSGDGRLSWNGESFGATGKLAVDAGYWQLAPSGMPRLSDDVVLRRSGQPPVRPKLELDLSVDLGRNFLFAGGGLSSRLAGDLRLRASGRDLPRASGSIRLRDGQFDAYGQQLAIERGRLTFQGLLDNPALDVLAVRKGLPVEAGVQISGTAQRPVIRLVSDPELPDAEKLAWLVLGHGPESSDGGDATVLLSAASGLLGNNSGTLVGQLKQAFGLDEFAVRQGELNGSGSRQVSSRIAGSSIDTTASTGSQILSIGKRLGANALLSYEQALGRAEGIVKLTVNLSRQVAVVGRAGSDNALDIFYTLSFGRPTGSRPPERPAERAD